MILFHICNKTNYGKNKEKAKYRITAVLKVETDIIPSIAASPTGQAVIMYVEIFKTAVIVFIGDVKMCLTSH